MLGIKKATEAVANSADSIATLSEDVNKSLGFWSYEIRTAGQTLGVAVIVALALSTVAVVMAAVAVSRRG